ncbi:unnamed protein product [Didymodactylos carnosus]|uniref:Uncharacterized protein n=1 Tax=Didymodactylos carnosus TaxID=1234261 RepID=A0A815ESZ9_9BILA|nr:unnamed protein product [Didymodactylos carnosus]CAF1543752.1 unnamed protein product [Didymodactylos carnosus]CAF4158259.1 unnamed protein product [Didymodactylos carnosus]CAF4332584.1 unnamed protein product [Didymodactylos carnosus]
MSFQTLRKAENSLFSDDFIKKIARGKKHSEELKRTLQPHLPRPGYNRYLRGGNSFRPRSNFPRSSGSRPWNNNNNRPFSGFNPGGSKRPS